jgi:hypothetical protein
VLAPIFSGGPTLDEKPPAAVSACTVRMQARGSEVALGPPEAGVAPHHHQLCGKRATSAYITSGCDGRVSGATVASG